MNTLTTPEWLVAIVGDPESIPEDDRDRPLGSVYPGLTVNAGVMVDGSENTLVDRSTDSSSFVVPDMYELLVWKVGSSASYT